MTQGKPQPLKPGGGFSKRNAGQITVNTEDVQRMQAGYEGRLGQQVTIINRLKDLVDARTDQLTVQMQQENDRARSWGVDDFEQVRIVDRPQITYTEDDADAVTQLCRLIPKDWDLVNEDDKQATMLAGYIKWLQEEVEHQRGKQVSLGESLKGSEQSRLAGEQKLAQVQGQLDEATRNLQQAIVDARHNAKVANAAFKQVQNDSDDPPWLDGGTKATHTTVAPTVLERHTPTVVLDPVRDGESETVEFDGFRGHAGEQRPGSF